MGAVNHTSLAREVPNSCRLAYSSQSMALPMQPSGESWFPQLSTFPLQPDTANPSCIHFACLICIITHTTSNKLGKKASSPQLTFSSCWMILFWCSRCFCWWFRYKLMQKISYSSCKKSCLKMSLGLTTLLPSWWEAPFHVWQRGKGTRIVADDWKHIWKLSMVILSLSFF